MGRGGVTAAAVGGPPQDGKCGCPEEDSVERGAAQSGGRGTGAGTPSPQRKEKGFGEQRLRTGAPGLGVRAWKGGGLGGGAGSTQPGPANAGNQRRFDVCAPPPRRLPAEPPGPRGVRGAGAGRPRAARSSAEARGARAAGGLLRGPGAPGLGRGEPGVRALAEPQNQARGPRAPDPQAPGRPLPWGGTWRPEERAPALDAGTGGGVAAGLGLDGGGPRTLRAAPGRPGHWSEQLWEEGASWVCRSPPC